MDVIVSDLYRIVAIWGYEKYDSPREELFGSLSPDNFLWVSVFFLNKKMI